MSRAGAIAAWAALLAAPALARSGFGGGFGARGGGGPMFQPSRVELFAPRSPGGNYMGFVHLSGFATSPLQGQAEMTLTDSNGAALATGNHAFALDFNHPSKEIVFPIEGANLRAGCAPPLAATVDLQLTAGAHVEHHQVPLQVQPGAGSGAPGTCPP